MAANATIPVSLRYVWERIIYLILRLPPPQLGEGNVLSHVCLSVCLLAR